MLLPSKPNRTVAFVERDHFDGGNSFGGGKKTRVSLALPSDARLRFAIMPDARVGGIKEPAQDAPQEPRPKRAIVVAEFIPPLLDWMKDHGRAMTTNDIADHPDVTELAGKPMSRNAMHSILSRMLNDGLLNREYVIVRMPRETQTNAARACLWSVAK